MNLARLVIPAFVLCSSLAVAEVVDTFPAVDTSIAPLGELDGAQAYPQTFVVPTDAPVLRSFSFAVRARTVIADDGKPVSIYPGDTTFDFVVMKWDDTVPGAIGTVVFEAKKATTIRSRRHKFAEIEVNTHKLQLEPGEKYAAILVTAAHLDGVADGAEFEFVNATDPYLSGEFLFLVDGFDLTQPWDAFFVPHDLGFRATFSAAHN